MSKTWAVIGGGNGGHATAGHLALNNHKVRIYDIFDDTIDTISKQGGIYVEGVINGFAKLELATTDIGQAITGADIVIVVAPAFAHREIAEKSAPYLKSNQKVLLHPGSTFGALEFLNVLRENGNYEEILVGETLSLLYATRIIEKGRVGIFGMKEQLPIATIPSYRGKEMVEDMSKAFPQMNHIAKNVFETSLQNLNAVMHPLPTILNTSMIESQRDWMYYYDGITESIGDLVCQLDNERINIGKALDIDLTDVRGMYRILYNAEGKNLTEQCRNVKAYAGVKGHTSVKTRYLLEDIPMGLMPMVSLGKMLGVDVSLMEATVKMAQAILHDDFNDKARTVENIGIAGMTKEELIEFVNTGKKLA